MTSDIERLSKILEKDHLVSKQSILKAFLQNGYIFQINCYITLSAEFVGYVLLETKNKSDAGKYPLESVVYCHSVRIKRYLEGLACLSRQIDDSRMFHCIDSYYPVLKSLFELFVESRLVVAFFNEFGDSEETRHSLVKRIFDYTDIQKKKNNYRFLFNDIPGLVDHIQEPDSVKNYFKKGKSENLTDQKNVAKKLGKDRAKDIKHWFPTRNKSNKPFSKNDRKDLGSMRWRCEDVLGEYLPYEAERKLWKANYSTLYEILNRYSHPALGYDDNFRPEPERLFDLFQVICPIIITFDKFILPNMLQKLDFRIENHEHLLKKFENMEALKEIILKFFVISSLAADDV